MPDRNGPHLATPLDLWQPECACDVTAAVT